MIITYPTGLYSSVLPLQINQIGNITFTISNNNPPRTQLLFIQTPDSFNHRRHTQRVFSNIKRRASLGNLVYSVSSSNASMITTGTKQFEAGQTLEFDNSQVADQVQPMLVSSPIEVQHNTNLLDYSSIGLDESTRSLINNSAASAYQQVSDQLNTAIQNRTNYEMQIETTQKTINEVGKVLSALAVLISISSSSQLLTTQAILISQQSQLSTELAQLVDAANQAANQATTLLNTVNQVAQLVR